MTSTPDFLEPMSLTALGINGKSLIASIEYQDTRFVKTGVQALLHKLPIIKTLQPFRSPDVAMDIDLSCVILDRLGKAQDIIWYGNLRDDRHAIRHCGDVLHGAKTAQDIAAQQEEIRLKLTSLDENITHFIFIISSHHKHPLHKAIKAIGKLSDNENTIAHKFSFDVLDKQATAIIAWHIKRQNDDFVLTSPLHSFTLNTTDSTQLAQLLKNAANAYLSSLSQ